MNNQRTDGRTKGTPNTATRETTLTPKQARFVSEYLKDLNGAAAAVRTGYSPKTADRQAYALLRKPDILRAVTATEAQRLEENNISATRVLEETRRIALNDPRRFLTADGNVQPTTLWTADMAAAVASIEVVKKQAGAGEGHTTTVVKLRFWNKNQAIELLAKHLQLLDPAPVDPAEGVPCFIMPPGTHVAIA